MHWLQIVRLVVLSFVVLCSVIVAPISAHITAFAVENFNVYYSFAILGIVTGALSLISLAVMLIVDALRTGAVTSMVVVELSWFSVLWVLWIATGALTADQTAVVFSTCQFLDPLVNQLCHETQSIEAFSFLAWLALMAYTIILFVVALINANRGQPIWYTSVRQSPPVAPPVANPNAANPNPNMNMAHPNAPMQQYPPPQPMYGMPVPNPNASGPQAPQVSPPLSPVHQQQPSYAPSSTNTARNSGFYPSA